MSKKKGPRSCTSSWQPEAYWTPSVKSKFSANCYTGFWAHIPIKHKEGGWKYGACPRGLLSCLKHFNQHAAQKVRRFLSPATSSRAHAVSAQCLCGYYLMPVCPELLLPAGSCLGRGRGGAFLHIQPRPLQENQTLRGHTAHSEAHGLARAGRLLDSYPALSLSFPFENRCCSSLGGQGHSCASRLWIPGHSLYEKTS